MVTGVLKDPERVEDSHEGWQLWRWQLLDHIPKAVPDLFIYIPLNVICRSLISTKCNVIQSPIQIQLKQHEQVRIIVNNTRHGTTGFPPLAVSASLRTMHMRASSSGSAPSQAVRTAEAWRSEGIATRSPWAVRGWGCGGLCSFIQTVDTE